MSTLSAPPNPVWLFGKVGCGKSFASQLIADRYGYYWYEGDQDLTPKMVEAIHRKETFTQEMRDEYYQILGNKLESLLSQHEKVIVSQALYRQKNRDELLDRFPSLLFVWVKSSDPIIDNRLVNRGDWVDPALARKKSAHFEIPPPSYPILENDVDGEEQILTFWKEICAVRSA